MAIFYTLGTEDGIPNTPARFDSHEKALAWGRSECRAAYNADVELYVIKVTTQVVSNRVRP